MIIDGGEVRFANKDSFKTWNDLIGFLDPALVQKCGTKAKAGVGCGKKAAHGCCQRSAQDAVDEDGNLVYTFDVPGVAAGDIEVEVHLGKVSVVAKRRDKGGEVENTYRFNEYASCRFDTSKTKAELENGVLKVSIPVAETYKDTKVEVSLVGGEEE